MRIGSIEVPIHTLSVLFVASLVVVACNAGSDDVELRDGMNRKWPTSDPADENVPYRTAVGTHCGFGPIDFDGSFWEALPSANTDALPDPGDWGVVILESEEKAVYVSSTGIEIRLTRMPDEYVDLELCM